MKITLLGDSIREIGYGTKVPQLLGKDFEVFQPNDNCRFAQYTLRGLFEWAEQMQGSKIVHFNNGHWDICNLFSDGSFTAVDDYVKTVLRIADILQKRHDVVIFATTTPVRDSNIHSNNEMIKRYNCAVVPELQKRGVIINDLNALLINDIDRYIRADDNIHLTDEGIDVCSKQVVSVIKTAAQNI